MARTPNPQENVSDSRPRLRVVRDEDEATTPDASQAQDTPEQRSIREQVRSSAIEKVRAAVSSSRLMSERDVGTFQDSLRESELEQHGHTTHEQKLRWLQRSSSEMIPRVISEQRQLESQFFSAVGTLEGAGMDRDSADRWREYMKGDKLWINKQSFLKNKFFSDLYPRWKNLLSEEKALTSKLRSVKGADKIAEVIKFKSSEYKRASLSTRESMMHSTYAAIAAQETGRSPLYAEAKEKLNAAASGENRVLSPTKINLWLRRIFEGNADEKLIREFVHGSAHDQLGGLIGNWTWVRGKFDDVEGKRQKNKQIAPGFHFVTLDTFLNWHYDARVAYVKEADGRLNAAPEGGGHGLLLDIRRELDMRDWRSAEALILEAKKTNLSEDERRQITSMQEYLKTQRAESPKTKEEEVHDNNPQSDMYMALAELKHLDGSMYDLYVRAMARGEGALRALCGIMYNRCWVRGRHIMDDSDEATLRERAKEETKEVVEQGHTKKYENNYIPGYGQDAIRDQDQHEWSPQVLHIGSDPAAHEALVAKCDAQKNNYSFKYWSTLIPEDVGYSQHQYIVFNLQWRLKSGMRSMNKTSANDLLTEKSTAPAPKKESLAKAA
jgi:hypothetical protein